jgi:hypothetical protein
MFTKNDWYNLVMENRSQLEIVQSDEEISKIKPSLVKEKYFVDLKFTKSEVELLFALRPQIVTGIKKNFFTKFKRKIVDVGKGLA